MDTPSPLQAKTGMLIRRPVAEVFSAFTNPAVTTRFWFTKSSGPLETGKTVRWDWEMYQHSAEVEVRIVEAKRRIVIEWPAQNGRSTVEWLFTAQPDGSTFVSIINSGFQGSQDEIVSQVIDATEGFTLVLAGAKAWLEYGVELKLVGDRFPGGL